MVKFVIKKNGDKVPYDENKTKHSVIMAAKEAGLDEEKGSALADHIVGMVLSSYGETDTVSTVEMKDKILAQLDASHPEVASAWRKYDAGRGR